jgi:Ca-activated chloride channel homolog
MSLGCTWPSAAIVFRIVAAACLTTFSASAHAQQNSNSPVQNSTAAQEAPATQRPLEAKTELVKLDVSVLDASGKFVGGLTQDKFRVMDNGAERPIVFFTPVEAPARVVVLLETSPAVYVIQDEHVAASYLLVAGLAQDDEVALVTYADVPRQLVPFTTDKGALLKALSSNQYMMGMASLNLYDAIAAVVTGISPMPGKKAIVLLSTGLDTSGPERFDRLVQKLRTEDVVIFAVGLGGSLHPPDPDPKAKGAKKPKKNATDTPSEPGVLEKARMALQQLAATTGGEAYFPGGGQDFAMAYQEIASALRHEYVLGIVPQHDGQLHKLSVSVATSTDPAATGHKKSHAQTQYRVSAREGYVAPPQ